MFSTLDPCLLQSTDSTVTMDDRGFGKDACLRNFLKMRVTKLQFSNDQLMRFLNGEGGFAALAKKSPEWKRLQDELRQCVDQIIKYEESWSLSRRRARRHKMAQALYRNVWTTLERLLQGSTLSVHPGTVFAKPDATIVDTLYAPYKVFLGKKKIPDIPNLKRVFSNEGFALLPSPADGNYGLAFINLLCDPELGIEKIGKCELCGKIFEMTYRRVQRFCGNDCRYGFHNKSKKPTMATT
jgi:hypothetical protein